MKYISIGAAIGAVLGVLIIASDASQHPIEGVLIMAVFIIPIFAIIGMLFGWLCLAFRKERRDKSLVDKEELRPSKPRSPGPAVALTLVVGFFVAAILATRLAASESTAENAGYLKGALVGWVIGSLAQVAFLFRKHEKSIQRWKGDTEQWERRQEAHERNKDRGICM